jgi:hypothetical protein
MELIRRRVLIEDLISRKSPITLDGKKIVLDDKGCLVVQSNDLILSNTTLIDFKWGEIVVDSFDVNIFLTQTIDDIGIFKDVEYVDEIPDYTILNDYYDQYLTGLTFNTPSSHDSVFTGPYTLDQKLLYRLRGQTVEDYFYTGGTVTGLTSSVLNIAKSYKRDNPYDLGFNLNSDPTNYFTGVLSLTTGDTSYVVDAIVGDITNSGIHYKDENTKRIVYDDIFKIEKIINNTIFSYKSQGWNESNISLSALTKEEVDLGIVFPHKIENDLFIDRGINSVLENQMRLTEISNLNQFERYENGYYNVKTQY